MKWASLFVLAAVVLAACGGGKGQSGLGDRDPLLDDCATVEFGSGVPVSVVFSGVDILVVMDNSGSMAEEQASLTAAFGGLVEALLNPPDLDGNGYREATLHDLPFGCPLYAEVTALDAGGMPVYSGRADGIVLVEGERRFVEMTLTPDNAISLLGATLAEPAFGLTATALAGASRSASRSAAASTSTPMASRIASRSGTRGQGPASSIGVPWYSTFVPPRTSRAICSTIASVRSIMSR